MSEIIVICFMCGVVAMLISLVLNPMLVHISYKRGLTDRPNHRKLQQRPVPMLGGVSVAIGLVVGAMMLNAFNMEYIVLETVCALILLFFLGLIDDLADLRARIKLVVQIALAILFWFSGFGIYSLTGVIGIYQLPGWVSIAISLFACVGLMNAINMVDGVDGLSSGICMLASLICGYYFFLHGDLHYFSIAVIVFGSLLPFFIFNVFSEKYKIFLGDSGSLVLGTIGYLFVVRIIQEPVIGQLDLYRTALTIAVFSIPVADTLRVAVMRVVHGRSPFTPDRTHLHHALTDLGLPHFMVTIIELSAILIVATIVWYFSARSGMDVTVQFFLVAAVSWGLTWFHYVTLAHCRDHDQERFARIGERIVRFGAPLIHLHQRIRHFVDKL